MPVWLDAIPDNAPKARRPVTLRWLMFLAVMLITGTAVCAWLWTGPREGLVFWLTASGLPLCLWGLLFLARRFAYKTEQVAATAWDRERQTLIENETRRGQQPAWLLSAMLETRAGNHPDAVDAVLQASIPVTEHIKMPGKTRAVIYAALPERRMAGDVALKACLAKITASVAETLIPLKTELPCWLLIDADMIEHDAVLSLVTQQLSERTGRVFYPLPLNGPAGLDYWYDSAGETPSLLVVISLHLPEEPADNGADAIVSLVLTNRESANYPHATMLHRPEPGSLDSLHKTLERSLLWAGLPAKALAGAWMTGRGLMEEGAWNGACESNGVTFSLSQQMVNPDPVLGSTGIAAPWLCIALASNTLSAGESLAIACEMPGSHRECWVMVVKQDSENKGLTGNV